MVQKKNGHDGHYAAHFLLPILEEENILASVSSAIKFTQPGGDQIHYIKCKNRAAARAMCWPRILHLS